MRTITLVALLLTLALFAAACGDEDAGAVPGAPDGVSDEEYLEALCSGTQKFAAALIAQSTPDALRAVITEYIAEMEAIVPPRDVSRFHQDYLAYLREAEAEPALMVSGSPPVPPEPARVRIASKENAVDACKEPVYFGQGAD